VIYDPSVILGLVRTMAALLDIQQQCVVFIANTIRNPTTYEQFRQALREERFNVELVHKDEAQAIEILQLRSTTA
jgi:ribosome maturation protein Sdo1